jgi:predicted metal-dependent hydrolase
MKRHLRVGSTSIVYSLALANTRRFTITVYPDLSVRVRAPRGTRRAAIERRIRHRVPWIVKQFRYFHRFHPLPVPPRYVSGETHRYLGRQYRLRVRRGTARAKLSPPFLIVTHPEPSRPRAVRDVLRNWYRERAENLLPRRLKRVLEASPWLSDQIPTFRIRQMTTRWGSCGPSGTLSFSAELMKTPLACIDYVIAHELCHRIELNHSRRFFALLDRAMPGWAIIRERLNKAGRSRD